MGDKIKIGNIEGNSGQIAIGKDINISISIEERNVLIAKIEELIVLLRKENISEDKKQLLITNFDKIREEIVEDSPDKIRISKWLDKTKSVFNNLVFSHEVTQAIEWIYKGLNSIF